MSAVYWPKLITPSSFDRTNSSPSIFTTQPKRHYHPLFKTCKTPFKTYRTLKTPSTHKFIHHQFLQSTLLIAKFTFFTHGHLSYACQILWIKEGWKQDNNRGLQEEKIRRNQGQLGRIGWSHFDGGKITCSCSYRCSVLELHYGNGYQPWLV